MTTCELMQAQVLDESLPRADGLEAHLASCAACGAVAAAHRAALRLRATTPALARRRPMEESRRRAGVLFGLVLSVAGGLGWWWVEARPVAPALNQPGPGPAALEEPVQVVDRATEADEAAQWAALLRLQRLADRTVVAEYREEEVTNRVFGALPKWVAPTRSSPLRSLGSAASPVVYTQEDVP